MCYPIKLSALPLLLSVFPICLASCAPTLKPHNSNLEPLAIFKKNDEFSTGVSGKAKIGSHNKSNYVSSPSFSIGTPSLETLTNIVKVDELTRASKSWSRKYTKTKPILVEPETNRALKNGLISVSYPKDGTVLISPKLANLCKSSRAIRVQFSDKINKMKLLFDLKNGDTLKFGVLQIQEYENIDSGIIQLFDNDGGSLRIIPYSKNTYFKQDMLNAPLIRDKRIPPSIKGYTRLMPLSEAKPNNSAINTRSFYVIPQNY